MNGNKFDPLEAVKEILYFLAVSAIAFVWMLLMLLIVSFVAVSVLKIKLTTMIFISLGFMVLIDIYYVIRRAAKKRKDREIQERLRGVF